MKASTNMISAFRQAVTSTYKYFSTAHLFKEDAQRSGLPPHPDERGGSTRFAKSKQ